MTKETFFKGFNSKIQSVLLYSSEIWGLHRLDSIERVHLMACKRYLGVPIRTPNKMVYGELGRFPLFVASYVRCVKYWFRLLQMEHTRHNQAYRMLISLVENGKKLGNGDTRSSVRNWFLFCMVTTGCWRCKIISVRFQVKTFRPVYPGMDCRH